MTQFILLPVDKNSGENIFQERSETALLYRGDKKLKRNSMQ